MTLQGSGAISIGDIAAEFGGTTPHSISEYYSADVGVPASGTIALSDFYGTAAPSNTILPRGSTLFIIGDFLAELILFNGDDGGNSGGYTVETGPPLDPDLIGFWIINTGFTRGSEPAGFYDDFWAYTILESSFLGISTVLVNTWVNIGGEFPWATWDLTTGGPESHHSFDFFIMEKAGSAPTGIPAIGAGTGESAGATYWSRVDFHVGTV